MPSKARHRSTKDPSQPSIPLAQPDRTPREPTKAGGAPTLLELVERRHRELQRHRPDKPDKPDKPDTRATRNDKHKRDTTHHDQGPLKITEFALSGDEDVVGTGEGARRGEGGGGGRGKEEEEEEDDQEVLTSFEHALFYAASFTMLHFTLDVLVHHQYAIELDWSEIRWRTARAFPFLLLLIYTTTTILQPSSLTRSTSSSASSSSSSSSSPPPQKHSPTTTSSSRPHSSTRTALTQLLFFLLSTGAGCYLIYASNEEPYLAVMKRAPPLGTLWVWSVVELKLPWALLSLFVVGAWFWRGGYSVF